MNYRELKMMAETLAEGETWTPDECPFCGRPKKFGLTRYSDYALYHCFSTHCLSNGRVNLGRTSTNVVRTTKKEQKARPWTGQVEELTDEQARYLSGKVGFGPDHCRISGVLYAPVEDRYAYPIFAPSGKRRGWVLRTYTGVGPKTLTRPDGDDPHTSWYGASGTNRVLVVEDIPSAVRASFHFPGFCVAMCGGGMGPDYVQEVRAYAKDVTWAFDSDATHSAISHHRRFGVHFDQSRVLVLDRDLKDLDEPSLKEKLSCLN